MPTATKVTEVTMKFKKETKRTFQYAEEGDDVSEQDIGSIYLKQHLFTGARPESVKVTVTVG